MQENGEFKMKSREQLTAEGFSFQCVSYAQLRERFNTDKKVTGVEHQKIEFET